MRARRQRMRRNDFKLEQHRFRLDVKKKFLTVTVVRHWNRQPRVVVDALFLEVLKARVAGAVSNLSTGRYPCLQQEGVN